MSTYGDLPEFLDDMTEGQALDVFYQLSRKWGWAGTVFIRNDVETEWQNQQYDPETGLTSGEPLPDDVWDAVQDTWEWRKAMTARMCEVGSDMVRTAVEDVVRDAMTEDMPEGCGYSICKDCYPDEDAVDE